jgi:hypothetical protein
MEWRGGSDVFNRIDKPGRLLEKLAMVGAFANLVAWKAGKDLRARTTGCEGMYRA